MRILSMYIFKRHKFSKGIKEVFFIIIKVRHNEELLVLYDRSGIIQTLKSRG